jgi:hypothetical protein
MTSDTLLTIPALLAAVGVGLLSWRGLQALAALINARTRRRVVLPTRQQRTLAPLPDEELFSLPNLTPYMLAGAVLGGWISMNLFLGPLQFLGPLAGLLPLLWKRQRIRDGRQQLRQEVADLVETLRLYLAFAPTPGAALTLALGENRPGVLWERLQRRRDMIYLDGPEAALNALAIEVRSPDLHRLLARLRAAQAGSGAFTPALRAAAAELTAELQREMEELVEAAPTRLILPLIALFMPPLLLLALSAPVQAFLDTMAGVGPVPLLGR